MAEIEDFGVQEFGHSRSPNVEKTTNIDVVNSLFTHNLRFYILRCDMDMNEYQRKCRATAERTYPGAFHLFGLVGEVGSIVSAYKKRLRYARSRSNHPNFREELTEELGDALWYLANLATREGLSLNKIADANIKKAKAFDDKGRVNRFDSKYDKDERFPRRFSVTFFEKKIRDKTLVKIRVGNVNIGDTLTDNAYGQDGYRYHDAFHLAYVAVLGWSPVIRALLKLKRKSNHKTDEVEDGARAQIVEEAIANYVFNSREREGLYSDQDAISFHVIQTVQSLASGLEVKGATAKQWRKAIHLGFQIFEALTAHRGGTVKLDLNRQEISHILTPSSKEQGDENLSGRKQSKRVAKRRGRPAAKRR